MKNLSSLSICFNFLLILTGCKSIVYNNLDVIDFTTTFNSSIEIGKPNYKDIFAIKVVDYQNVRAFIIPFQNERTTRTLLSNGDIEIRPTTYDTTFVYCIMEKGMSTGLRYDSLTAISFQKFPIDSLLNRINIGNEQLDGNSIAEGALVQSLMDKKNNKLSLEKYVSEKTVSIDSTYRYFDYSMKEIEFTIAPSIDKKYNNKLVKVVNIRKSKINNTKDKFTTEIKIGKLENPYEIIKLLERFKKDNKKS